MSESSPRGKKQGCCSTWIGKTKDGREVYMRLYPFQERRTGMAGQLELEDRLPIPETDTKTRRTLWNNRSLGASHLSLKTPKPMANPQCLSRVTLIILLQDQNPRPQLYETTPDLVEGEKEYEIEVITSHKKWGQGYWYLVKWKGYPISDNTWEPASGFKNAQEIWTEYQLTYHLVWLPLTSKPHSLLCFSYPQTTKSPPPSVPDPL